MEEQLAELAAKVARRLRSHGFLARTVTLKARYPAFTTHTRSETLPEPSDSSVDVAEERTAAASEGRRSGLGCVQACSNIAQGEFRSVDDCRAISSSNMRSQLSAMSRVPPDQKPML